MDKEWSNNLMQDIKTMLDEYTDMNELAVDEESGFQYLQSGFSVTEDDSAAVLMQALIFELREGTPQLELLLIITNELEEAGMEEILKTVNGLNYVSPIGSFGVKPEQQQLFVRTCMLLSRSRKNENQVMDIKKQYEIMIDGVSGVYEQLREIWTGKLTYEDALGKDLI